MMDGDTAPRRRLGPASDRELYVAAGRILHDWKEAHGRALAYLAALGLEAQEHAPLAARAVERALTEPWERGGDAVSETLRVLRQLVQEEHPGAARRRRAPRTPSSPGASSGRWRGARRDAVARAGRRGPPLGT